MRAITIWQPWASLIADGLKTIETRKHDRFKSLLGQQIAIHAAKSYSQHYLMALGNYVDTVTLFKYIPERLPFGCVLATAEVVAHRELNDGDSSRALCSCATPPAFLGYKIYGLFLEDIKKFDEPIPAKGQQGIWIWQE